MKPRHVIPALICVLLLYLLSIGPAYRIWILGAKPSEVKLRLPTYRKVYAPVIWICANSALAKGALDFYGRIWAWNAPMQHEQLWYSPVKHSNQDPTQPSGDGRILTNHAQAAGA